MTAVDPRLTRARDALDMAALHPLETLPPSVMTRELAELRQSLAGAVDLIDEGPTPFEETDADHVARRADLIAALGFTPEPETSDEAVVEVLAAHHGDAAHVVARWLRAAAGVDAKRLAAIRAVLAAFDWEFHDRQLALEEIERIAGGAS